MKPVTRGKLQCHYTNIIQTSGENEIHETGTFRCHSETKSSCTQKSYPLGDALTVWLNS
jgi:hypothetical protein